MVKRRDSEKKDAGTSPAGAPAEHGGLLAAYGRSALVDRLAQSAERRRHRRIPWEPQGQEPVLMEVEEPGRAWRPVSCTIVDLAAGGLGVLAAEPLAPGSRVRLTLTLPNVLDERSGAPDRLPAAPWSSMAEVVHTRPLPAAALQDRPADEAEQRVHHHGLRFHGLKTEAEGRLLHALYGPMPEGWGIERYSVRRPVRAGRPDGGQPAVDRYAVVRDGKRLVQGFGSYDRARDRAWSLYMDEQIQATRRARSG